MSKPSGFNDLGIDENDFYDNEYADFGRDVTVEVFTGTVDSMGSETNPVSISSKSIQAVIHVRTKTKIRTPEGIIEKAPAYMMSRVIDSVGTGNRITDENGQKFRVKNVMNRDGIFNYSDLYPWG